ncbi:MAG: prolipoprotein diacylglyceryl transferase [Candidatus Pacebacteria bacterium]|nr:prolipoprotein diacylglyceryl transferase [Candidatus Paceibacterota bacterium]PIR59860.1 MAG: prolipoprotein diacylglyceryl transferase [Candidatus Pacebacteria bacterium CG10_big_fil_rev_8_21_14_0_10_45_6]
MLHWYGIFIAGAILVTYFFAEKRAKKIGISSDQFSRLATTMLIFGFIGARLWHVATDWSLYSHDLLAAMYVWRGGLSIFGGIVGGALGLWWEWRKLVQENITFFHLSDSILLVLPIGQALGRLGNWSNQELYGLPTNLPWKLYISPEHRLPEFARVSYYHPLFAYEAILLLLFTVALWRLEKLQPKVWKIGSGRVTIAYILFYCVLRFLLDFIRPDKQTFLATGFGVNQLVVALVAVTLSSILIVRKVTA